MNNLLEVNDFTPDFVEEAVPLLIDGVKQEGVLENNGVVLVSRDWYEKVYLTTKSEADRLRKTSASFISAATDSDSSLMVARLDAENKHLKEQVNELITLNEKLKKQLSERLDNTNTPSKPDNSWGTYSEADEYEAKIIELEKQLKEANDSICTLREEIESKSGNDVQVTYACSRSKKADEVEAYMLALAVQGYREKDVLQMTAIKFNKVYGRTKFYEATKIDSSKKVERAHMLYKTNSSSFEGVSLQQLDDYISRVLRKKKSSIDDLMSIA